MSQMTRAIELAIEHAIGLARMRTGRLASVTIECPAERAVDVVGAARRALADHALVDIEIHHQAGPNVRLAAIEIVPSVAGSDPAA